MNEVNPKLNSKTSGLAFSVSAVVFVILSLIVTSAMSAAGLKEEDDTYKYFGYLVAPAAIALSALATLKYTKTPFKATISYKCHWKYYFIGVLVIFGLIFALNKINWVITEYIFVPLGYTPRQSYLPSLDGGMVVLALVVIAVIPAVFEEYLFRGIILGGAEEGTGGLRAIFIVGLCFSLFHGSPEQTVYQFICGCAFALLAVRSRSVLPCVLIHFINNALVIILSACGAIGADGNLAIPAAADITMTVLGAVALAAGIALLIFDKKPLKQCQKGAVAQFFIYASAGLALLVVIWAMSFV